MEHNKKLTRCYINSDTGSFRPNNEDNFVCNDSFRSKDAGHLETRLSLLDEGWSLCGVLDGMGGLTEGETASLLAAEEFARCWRKLSKEYHKTDVEEALREAFLRANNLILKDAGYAGTTATILATDGEIVKVFHLGDSRAFLVHQGSIRQLTKDQTIQTFKEDMGLEEQVREVDKHRLTEYLGADQTGQGIRPQETEWVEISEGDSFILCTDGVYEFCEPRSMLGIVSEVSPQEVSSSLLKRAILSESRDNVTCMYIC